MTDATQPMPAVFVGHAGRGRIRTVAGPDRHPARPTARLRFVDGPHRDRLLAGRPTDRGARFHNHFRGIGGDTLDADDARILCNLVGKIECGDSEQ